MTKAMNGEDVLRDESLAIGGVIGESLKRMRETENNWCVLMCGSS